MSGQSKPLTPSELLAVLRTGVNGPTKLQPFIMIGLSSAEFKRIRQWQDEGKFIDEQPLFLLATVDISQAAFGNEHPNQQSDSVEIEYNKPLPMVVIRCCVPFNLDHEETPT